MVTFQQQKQQVLQLFDQTVAIAKNQKDTKIEEYLKKSQERFVDEKIYAVVCGEFKKGKSSLINAFLDEPDLFPVAVKITTNLVSIIYYGKQEKINVILGDIGKAKPKEITRSEIPDYVTEQKNKGNNKNAKMLIIESPNTNLKDGLVLADTPGIGSLNIEHTAITDAFIPSADVILYVSDIQPLGDEDLKFIKEKILPHSNYSNIIFVVTKIDAIIDYQTLVDSNREKISKLLNIPPDEICIIAVSSDTKQEYLKNKDEELLKESNFLELQEKIWSLVKENRGQILLLRALSNLGISLQQIKRPLEEEWQSCKQSSEKIIKREEEIKKIIKQRQDLLDNDPEWKTKLGNDLHLFETEAQTDFQGKFIKLKRQSSQYLDNPEYLNNPEQIAILLESDIDAMMVRLNQKLNSKVTEIYQKTKKTTGLNLNPFPDISLEDRERANFAVEDIEIKSTSFLEKTSKFGQTKIYMTTAGGIFGGLIGGILGATAGLLAGGVGIIGGAIAGAQIGAGIGSLAGATTGIVQGIRQVSKEDQALAKQEISKILGQYLEDSQLLCFQTLRKEIISTKSSMQNELKNEIKQETESYKNTLELLQQSRNRSVKERDKRVIELEVPLQRLTQIQQKVKQMAITITTQTESRQAKTEPPTSSKSTAKGSNTDAGHEGYWEDEQTDS